MDNTSKTVFKNLEKHGWIRDKNSKHIRFVHPTIKEPIVLCHSKTQATGIMHKAYKIAGIKP